MYPPELYPFPTAAVQERWREFAGWAAVAERDGAGLGFVAVAPPWLEALYVLPHAWGTDVAGRLHDAALQALATAGVGLARLWVLEENARARRFYERRGWTADGSTRVVAFPPNPIDLGYVRAIAP